MHRNRIQLPAVLLGLLALGMAILSPLQAPPTALADDVLVVLETKWLVLRKEDIGPLMVQTSEQISQDDRGIIHVRRFDPDYKNREDIQAPTLVLNKLFQTRDAETAKQIFDEQAGAGFPEAPGSVQCIGGMDLPNLGDQWVGYQGYSPCDSQVVHTRIVERYLNVVNVVYAYGLEAYTNTNVVTGFALTLSERARTVPNTATAPTMPAADLVWDGWPKQLAIGIAELGKEISGAGDKEGVDANGVRWYEQRWKRGREAESKHFGPMDIYTKFWVAPSIEIAQGIFQQQAKPGFPEAKETVGTGQFPEPELEPNLGAEHFLWNACNDNCGGKGTRYIHRRYVVRSGNVVFVLYTWGGNPLDNKIEHVQQWSEGILGRIK